MLFAIVKNIKNHTHLVLETEGCLGSRWDRFWTHFGPPRVDVGSILEPISDLMSSWAWTDYPEKVVVGGRLRGTAVGFYRSRGALSNGRIL